jgi:hypothetical protein
MKRFAVQVMLYLDAETKNGAIRDVENLFADPGAYAAIDDYAIQTVIEEDEEC